jgi:hypothetical protein
MTVIAASPEVRTVPFPSLLFFSGVGFGFVLVFFFFFEVTSLVFLAGFNLVSLILLLQFWFRFVPALSLSLSLSLPLCPRIHNLELYIFSERLLFVCLFILLKWM